MNHHVAIARYNKKINAVVEKEVFSANTFQECYDFVSKHREKPLYAYYSTEDVVDEIMHTNEYQEQYKLIVFD